MMIADYSVVLVEVKMDFKDLTAVLIHPKDVEAKVFPEVAGKRPGWWRWTCWRT